jgi:hypothetical protein
VGSAVLVAVRGLTRPLSALATAARTLGTPAEGEALAEVGPAEVRQVARAFNDMRQRIGAMVDEKTRMLAAISHDLRAPITRMRLRVELLEDAEARAKLIADLEELHRLTDEALDFLRGAGACETWVGGEPMPAMQEALTRVRTTRRPQVVSAGGGQPFVAALPVGSGAQLVGALVMTGDIRNPFTALDDDFLLALGQQVHFIRCQSLIKALLYRYFCQKQSQFLSLRHLWVQQHL